MKWERIKLVLNLGQTVFLLIMAIYLGVQFFGPMRNLNADLKKVLAKYSELIAVSDTLVRQSRHLMAVTDSTGDINERLLQMAESSVPAYVAHEVAALRASLDSLSNVSGTDSLSQRLAALEAALGTTPDRALAIPLLRNDLVAAIDRMNRIEDSVAAQINAADNRSLTLAGLMIAVITLFGLSGAASLIGGLRKRKEPGRPPNT